MDDPFAMLATGVTSRVDPLGLNYERSEYPNPCRKYVSKHPRPSIYNRVPWPSYVSSNLFLQHQPPHNNDISYLKWPTSPVIHPYEYLTQMLKNNISDFRRRVIWVLSPDVIFARNFVFTMVDYVDGTDKAEISKQLETFIESASERESREMIQEILDQVVDGRLKLADLEGVACICLLLYHINL